MFYLYHHHDLNRLGELLAVLLEQRQRPHPLSSDTVLVPNRGIGRWLELELAASSGISANMDMPLPARFIWDLVPACLDQGVQASQADAFGRNPMTWHLYAILPQIAENVPAIHTYLSAEPTEVHRLQLARQLGDVFDQYLIYRPDLLTAWEAGQESNTNPDHWQASVWRALLERLGTHHRAELLRQFVDAVVDPEQIPGHQLPDTIYCFGLDQMPPKYMHLLYALGQRCDVHFLLPNPCKGYWGDIQTQRISLTAPPTADNTDAEEYAIEADHPLLASLGRGSRDFLRVLYSDELSAIQEPELGKVMAYEPPSGDTLLTRVQADLIHMQARTDTAGLGENDTSVQFHACHGPLREVQVLHDQLWDLLEHDKADSPRDIVVMLPDVATYAPIIHSVFGGACADRYLPYSVSDTPRDQSHPIIQTVRQLLDLPLTRWAASEILALADVPAVMRRFELDAAALNSLRRWTQEAGVRWGFNADTRRHFGASAFHENTWQFGLDRLLLGAAHNDDGALIDGVAPWTDLEGGATTALGQLWLLVDRLRHWEQTLTEPTHAADWQNRLNAMVDDLLAIDPAEHAEQTAMTEVRAAIDSLDTAAQCLEEEVLSWEAVHETVTAALTSPGERQPFLSSGITFCGLEPLRGVPFQVICLLGMDDGVFPRTEQSRAFNILRARPQIGDANVGDDDRLQFLQALTAARSVFYISYTGQNVASGEPQPPSTVVDEWLTFLHQHYFAGIDDASFQRQLITRQPMHPFSPDYFKLEPAQPRLFTYAREWQPAGQAGNGERIPAPVFDDGSRAQIPGEAGAEGQETILELGTLRRFWDNPAKHFLQQRLNMALDEDSTEVQDEEPQGLDGLSAYQIRAELLDDAQRDSAEAVAEEPSDQWRARGILPPPPLDAAPFADQAGQVNTLLPIWHEWCDSGDGPHQIDIDLVVHGHHLRGRIGNVWPDGLRVLRPGKQRLKHSLHAWIDYLAYRASGHEGELRLAGLDKNNIAQQWWLDLEPEQARIELATLVSWFDEGQQTPLLFLPSLAETYLRTRLDKEKEPEVALGKSNTKITDEWSRDFDAQDPYFQMLLSHDPPLGTTPGETHFCELAEAVCATLHGNLQQIENATKSEAAS